MENSLRIIVLLGLALVLSGFSGDRSDARVGHAAGVGSQDFIQYWSAYRLMRSDSNPYDSRLMLAMQKSYAPALQEPQICWNPPWLLTLLSPILRLSLAASSRLWMCLSLLLALLVGLAVVRTYGASGAMRPSLLIAFFLFQPLLTNLMLGQVGMLHAISMAGFLCFVSRRRDFVAGLMLVPATVKPHLVYLVVPLLGYWMFASKRWRVLLGLLLGFAALVGWTWSFYPHSIPQWLDAMATRPPMYWIVGTLVGVVRLAFQSEGAAAPTWPIVAIPGVSASLFCLWLLWRRPEPHLGRLLPPVLALSLFTAPYGWAFDQCQLLLIQVGLVVLAQHQEVPRATRRAICGAVASVQVVWTVQPLLGYRSLHHSFWSALALFAVWEYGMFKLRRANRSIPMMDIGHRLDDKAAV